MPSEGESTPRDVIRSTVEVGGAAYECLAVRTHWIQPGEDIVAVARRYLAAHLRPGDCAIVSEKATVIATGGGVPVAEVSPGRLARVLARSVRPIGDSRGLSIPEKMQLVVNRVGRARVVLAAAVSAVTRPLGIHGAFYTIAGDYARAVDGMRPPLEHVLLPPLDPRDAAELAGRLEASLQAAAAIVDINDRGGSIRALSPGAPGARELMQALRDNPLGQRDRSTPIGVVRRISERP
jgi:hypothetical protein